MPVDKFGRGLDTTTNTRDGVSLTYINNNFLRRDGMNTATGSVNMVGNTLTNVSNPVNDQDVATKSYVDVYAGGGDGKVNKSGDTMTGELNMNGNRITNLPDFPRNPKEAVSMAYVITKNDRLQRKTLLRSGNQAMEGHLNMDTHYINNIRDPADPQDAATKNYVDSRKPLTTVHAERYGDIQSNAYQWSFGNSAGSVNHAQSGYTMLSAGRVLRMGLAVCCDRSAPRAACSVKLVLNGETQ